MAIPSGGSMDGLPERRREPPQATERANAPTLSLRDRSRYRYRIGDARSRANRPTEYNAWARANFEDMASLSEKPSTNKATAVRARRAVVKVYSRSGGRTEMKGRSVGNLAPRTRADGRARMHDAVPCSRTGDGCGYRRSGKIELASCPAWVPCPSEQYGAAVPRFPAGSVYENGVWTMRGAKSMIRTRGEAKNVVRRDAYSWDS